MNSPAEIRTVLSKRTGITFPLLRGAEKSSLIAKAIRIRTQALGLRNEKTYLSFLNRPENFERECARLVDELRFNRTFFFREPAQFRFVATVAAGIHDEPIRAWSAGCSSGEEAYSLAFTLCDLELAQGFSVTASDINSLLVSYASMGFYSRSNVLRRIPGKDRFRYFTERPTGDQLRVRGEIRKKVRFESRNLLSSPFPKKKFHFIFCRNVLCHLAQDAAAKIVQAFQTRLVENGYLVVSRGEERLVRGPKWKKMSTGIFTLSS